MSNYGGDMNVYDYINLLCCPDCSGELQKEANSLACRECRRVYKVYEGICVDFIPKQKFCRAPENPFEEEKIVWYNKLFDEPFVWKENPLPWGLEVPLTYQKKVIKHKHVFYKTLPEKVNAFLDISTGSGRFSYDLAARADLCIFSDISVDSVVYVSKKALYEGKKNVLVFRIDYMFPPFKEGIINTCICNDTLVFGRRHEKELLSTIYKVLTPKGGIAAVDFANKYHHGFWHKPYTYGYSKNQMIQMLKDAGFGIETCIPLYYELSKELDEKGIWPMVVKTIVPPTRYIFKAIK